MPNGEIDYGYDERYMWYYNEDDEYTVPSDPRDDEGYAAYEEFWRIGKYSSRKYCESQIYKFKKSWGLEELYKVPGGWSAWSFEYDKNGNITGCSPPPELNGEIWVLFILGYVGYRIIR